MSDDVSRRSVLKAAGASGVGLAVAGLATGAATAYRRGLISIGELTGLPRVPENVRPTDRAALGRDETLKIEAAPALAARLIERRLTPGEGLEHLGVDVRQWTVEFICDSRRPNILLAGAVRVAYEIAEVAWQPAAGWPIYRNRSPHADPVFGMRYAGVPCHQIVLLDDRAVYVGNSTSCGLLNDIQGALRVDVNGDAHPEHLGFYKVLITAIA